MKRILLFSAVVAAAVFQPAAAQNTTPYWSLAGNSNAATTSKLGTTNSLPLRLVTKNVERLRIDSMGRVGVGFTNLKGRFSVFNGTTQPAAVWQATTATPVFIGFGEGSSGSGDFIMATASTSTAVRPVLIGRRSRGTLATPAMVANGDLLASWVASGYDGSAFQNAASFDFAVDGVTSGGRVPTRISFYTGSTAANRTERLRIGSNGNLRIGGPTLLTSTAKLQIKVDGSENSGGLYVESRAGNEEGSYNVGIGIDSRGAIGVRGTGGTGIAGYGSIDGQEGIGVYGQSTGIGVYGSADGGIGVQAIGDLGLYAEGRQTGFKVSADFFGIVARADIYGVEGYANASDGYGGRFTSAGTGLYAAAGSAPESFAAVFAGNVYASGTFQSSDKNLKQNIKELGSALDIIAKLKPRNYEFKTDEKLAALRLPGGIHYGLIAQDVEEVLPNLVKDVRQELNLTKAEDFKKLEPRTQQATVERPKREIMTIKSVNYTELIPIVIKGMQELSAKTDEIDELKKEVAELRKLVLDLKNAPGNSVTVLGGTLEQNTPNPVNGTTSIRYNVPQASASARLALTNSKGQVVKNITLGSRGSGTINLNTAALAAGTYNYTLYVDGVPTDTKRLVVTH